jgi:biotin transport system substrate-specific component
MNPATATVLSDLVPLRFARRGTIARDAVLVVSFAFITAIAAQISIPLGFTPVPLTGQTFAVLLAGSVLGVRRGVASQGLYWIMGLIGLPFYAGGEGGWSSGTGTTLGYFVGFMVAAAIVGYLAERRNDRNFVSSMSAMAMATVAIYACGATWLAIKLNIPFAAGETNALSLGVTPFLVGDVLKMALAGAIAPTVWAFASRR